MKSGNQVLGGCCSGDGDRAASRLWSGSSWPTLRAGLPAARTPHRLGPARPGLRYHPGVTSSRRRYAELCGIIREIPCPTLVVCGAESNVFLEGDAEKL